jgi:hypothetical protein
MSPKATSADEAPRPSGTSGKLVIIGIVVVALVAAVASWWFRYNATHQAAEFWGPTAAQLIRDASHVLLCRKWEGTEPTTASDDELLLPNSSTRVITRCHDVTAAPGILHLRNALLEDRSFEWPAKNQTLSDQWRWCLVFKNDAADDVVYVWFSPDLNLAANSLASSDALRVISCEPISAGLKEFFAEHFPNDPTAR